METFVLLFVAGVLTSVSPCIIPILPIIFAGASSGNRWAPLAISLGVSLSFALVGASLASTGHLLGFSGGTLRTFGAIVILISGLALMLPSVAGIFSQALAPLARIVNSKTATWTGSSVWGAFSLGAAMGLVWSPCAGPTLGAAIGLATQAGSFPKVLLQMTIFGLGASLPLLLMAYGSKELVGRLKSITLGGSTARNAKRLLGGSLCVVGLLVAFGLDAPLEAAILEALPAGWIEAVTRF